MTDSKPLNTAKLKEFKKLVHGYYIAHTMANYGMSQVAINIVAMEGYNPSGLFQVGAKDVDSKAWAEIENKLAIEGMTKDGPFSQMVAHGILVLIYELWNDNYRALIAKELNCKLNELYCDVMGDLRLIRHWIAHNNSIADNKVKKFKTLSWPNKEGRFFYTSNEMQNLQIAINQMTVYINK